MAQCPGSQSVMSKTMDYLEKCGLSMEYLRRGCTYTPTSVKWAGDLVVTKDATLHQSKMEWIRGEACEPSHTFPAASEDCGEKTVTPEGLEPVRETGIRSGGENSFQYTVAEGEPGWDTDITATNDVFCGGWGPADGGDVLFNFEATTQVKSLCGTIEIRSFADPKAFYLDNRKSFPEDPDNGLLVAIQNGMTGDWTALYAEKGKSLEIATDISSQFLDALADLGIDKKDVFSFGMI